MNPKSQEEIQIMTEGGRKLGNIRDALLEFAHPKVTLLQVEEHAQELIEKSGGTPSFKTVGGYAWATCLCVNDVIVHGIPTMYELRDGDLFTLDIGLLYKGFHTDTAWTMTVGGNTSISGGITAHSHFRSVGEAALEGAIREAKIGNRVGDISRAIQTTVEGAGYSVIRALVGHGVGRMLHEEPQIPGYLRGSVADTPELVEGMTIAIEVIYAEGASGVMYKGDDGWSIATRDGSLSAVFEHTIAITKNGPSVLTKSEK